MPRTILCSSGVSIAGKPYQCPSLPDLQKRGAGWDEDTSSLWDDIQVRLTQEIDFALDTGRTRASAEINALNRLHLNPDDEVILFATDTADGRCCAEAVRKVLVEHFGVSSVTVERVVGLQVRDKEVLRKTGIINLTRQLIHYLDDPQRRYGGGCLLNTNGGFKGLIPFFAILGMIFRAPVVYVFEFAECLISMPPLPIGFATDLFDRALPALTWARQTEVFAEDEFFRLIPGLQPDEREWFASFLEVAAGENQGSHIASLSPLANVLAQRESEGALEIWLSAEAKKLYDGLVGNLRREVDDHLRKLASPLWRTQHRDTKFNSDLEFYPRFHNPWRFAGYTKGNQFQLCWFTNQKKEYEDWIANKKRAGYTTDEFSRLVVPAREEIENLPVDDPDAHRTWGELCDELQMLRQESASQGQRLVELEQQKEDFFKQSRKERKRIEELEARLGRR